MNTYHVLNYVPGLTSRKIKLLGQRYSLPDLLAMRSMELEARGFNAAGIAYLKSQDWPKVHDDLAWASSSANHHLIPLDDPAYPALLKEIADPPFLLYGIGNKSLLSTPQIAMVGTRKPTANARETAAQFAASLAALGLTITSGLALGIDGASHQGALQADGHTIAVLGNGFNHVYPPSHRGLYAQIAERGLLLSEFSPELGPRAEHFPQRNRIISGLSIATLVVEAATKSGSLITARLAGEQGREVFAIPGSIHNLQARGCHQLIKQGAILVENVADIVEVIQPLLRRQLDLGFESSPDILQPVSSPSQSENIDKALVSLLNNIGYEPTPIELLIERSGQKTETLLVALMQLELGGYIESSGAGYTRLANKA
ncbi:MAG: DNA-processing protein DprA [Gammaproteobacteria bacterium]|nr:DNA-processing protein DprA [Gammaproteobacteria bacterium]